MSFSRGWSEKLYLNKEIIQNSWRLSLLKLSNTVAIWSLWMRLSPTPRISDTGSRHLPASLIRRVANSPHHRYGESAIEFFIRKLSVSMIRRVVDSPHQWYGESLIPRITESESRQLRVSPIRRVDDLAYHWVGELERLSGSLKMSRNFIDGTRGKEGPTRQLWNSVRRLSIGDKRGLFLKLE